jgi:hypothetical protein
MASVLAETRIDCSTVRRGVSGVVGIPVWVRFFVESSQVAWCGLVGEFIGIPFPVF